MSWWDVIRRRRRGMRQLTTNTPLTTRHNVKVCVHHVIALYPWSDHWSASLYLSSAYSIGSWWSSGHVQHEISNYILLQSSLRHIYHRWGLLNVTPGHCLVDWYLLISIIQEIQRFCVDIHWDWGTWAANELYLLLDSYIMDKLLLLLFWFSISLLWDRVFPQVALL